MKGKIIDTLCSPIMGFNLSTRTHNCIRAAEIDFIGDLVLFSKKDLRTIRNFGKLSLSEVDEFLKSKKLHFGMDLSKYDYYNEREKAIKQIKNNFTEEVNFLKNIKVGDEVKITKIHHLRFKNEIFINDLFLVESNEYYNYGDNIGCNFKITIKNKTTNNKFTYDFTFGLRLLPFIQRNRPIDFILNKKTYNEN